MKLQDIIERFTPPRKREWPVINPSKLDAGLDKAEINLRLRHARESDEHDKNIPRDSALPQDHKVWREAKNALEERHAKEEQELSELREAFKKAISDDLPILQADYSNAYQALKDGLKALRVHIPTASQFLQEQEGCRQRLQPLLEKLRKYDLIRDGKVEDWKKNFWDYCFQDACVDQGIHPEKEIPRPDKPLFPAQPKLETSTSIETPISFSSLIMLIGGLPLGAAVGAFIGGILYDSKGWHVQPAFWAALGIVTLISFMVGHWGFPRILEVRLLDTIDVSGYFSTGVDPENEEWKKQRKEQRKAETMAGLMGILLMLFFLVIMFVDYEGWSHFAVDRNNVVKGDEDAHLLTPWVAGLALAFFTAMMSAVKYALESKKANKLRREIEDELQRKKNDFFNAYQAFLDDERSYVTRRKEAEAYWAKHYDAELSANARIRGEEGGEVRRLVEEFERERQAAAACQRALEDLMTSASQEVEPQRQALENLEAKIDKIYAEAEPFLKEE